MLWPRKPAMWLFLGMGFHALAAQVVLLREMLVLVAGHELSIGMIMASWLTGIFAGAWGATRIRGSFPALFWLLTISPVLSLGLLLGVRHLRFLISVPPGAPISALGSMLAMVGFLLPQAAVVGAMFPVASALAARGSDSPAQAIGRVYFWEALGSLLGGLALSFWMIPHLHGPGILAWTGMLTSFLAALGVWGLSRPGGLGLGLVGVLWGVSLAGGLVSSMQEWSAQRRWGALHPGMERLVTVDSPYQNIELGRLEAQFTLFGNGRPMLTFPDPVEAAPLVQILMHQEPMPKRILLVGGGPASSIPLLLEYPVELIRLVELDPKVFEVSIPFLSPELRRALEDPRLQADHLDARFLISKLPPGSFDAAVVQMGDPSTSLLNRFHTLEFFQGLNRILGPDGLLLHGVSGSVHYLGPELERFLGMIYRSLEAVFPEVRVIPGEKTLFLAAKNKGRISLEPDVLAGRPSPGEQIPKALFFTWIQPHQVGLWEETLSRSREEPNLDEHPRSIIHFLALWEKLSGANLGVQTLKTLEGLPWGWILCGLGLLLTASLLGGRGFNLERIPLVALGVTGFTAMAQEMVCLYLYQAVWGYLYSKVGLLVGVFMAGLAAGGMWAKGILSPWRRNSLGALLGVQAGMTLLCASIPLLWVSRLLSGSIWEPPGPEAQTAVCFWMFLAGFATGGSFPLACGVLEKRLGSAGLIAGKASAWDHLGAAIGALLGGVVLVPTLGLARSGWVLAGLQAMATLWLGAYLLAGPTRRG
jgi:spermidine synthase